MSRRTRIKHNRTKGKFTLVHHEQYATTTTYFPRSYSLLGKDIVFPISILPLLYNDKINYVGIASNMMQTINNLKIQAQKIKIVSVCLQGRKYQQGSPIINFLSFFCSMICCCCGPAFQTSAYRNQFYPQYVFDDYEQIELLIRKFNSVQTLVINFQDNRLTKSKIERLDDAFCNSHIRHIVLRNLTYFIEVEGIQDFFDRIKNKRGVDFKFIWQKFTILSINNSLQPQEQSNLISMSEQVL